MINLEVTIKVQTQQQITSGKLRVSYIFASYFDLLFSYCPFSAKPQDEAQYQPDLISPTNFFTKCGDTSHLSNKSSCPKKVKNKPSAVFVALQATMQSIVDLKQSE
jgi:hypothetical protein